jgi:hypothetical protein
MKLRCLLISVFLSWANYAAAGTSFGSKEGNEISSPLSIPAFRVGKEPSPEAREAISMQRAIIREMLDFLPAQATGIRSAIAAACHYGGRLSGCYGFMLDPDFSDLPKGPRHTADDYFFYTKFHLDFRESNQDSVELLEKRVAAGDKKAQELLAKSHLLTLKIEQTPRQNYAESHAQLKKLATEGSETAQYVIAKGLSSGEYKFKKDENALRKLAFENSRYPDSFYALAYFSCLPSLEDKKDFLLEVGLGGSQMRWAWMRAVVFSMKDPPKPKKSCNCSCTIS